MSRTRRALRAVIVAAGRGTRFGGEIPKQFEMLGDIPVAMHSVRRLAALEGMREIVLVLPAGGWPSGSENIAQHFDEALAAPLRQVPGGERRQDSVARGLSACGDDPEQIILIHDAARPFPPTAGVNELVANIADTSAANPKLGGGLLAIRATDTIKRANAERLVIETLDRNSLWLAQTPQAIVGRHAEAVRRLLESDREFTDESGAIEALGLESVIAQGSTDNFKITQPEDLERARQLLRMRF